MWWFLNMYQYSTSIGPWTSFEVINITLLVWIWPWSWMSSLKSIGYPYICEHLLWNSIGYPYICEHLLWNYLAYQPLTWCTASSVQGREICWLWGCHLTLQCTSRWFRKEICHFLQNYYCRHLSFRLDTQQLSERNTDCNEVIPSGKEDYWGQKGYPSFPGISFYQAYQLKVWYTTGLQGDMGTYWLWDGYLEFQTPKSNKSSVFDAGQVGSSYIIFVNHNMKEVILLCLSQHEGREGTYFSFMITIMTLIV